MHIRSAMLTRLVAIIAAPLLIAGCMADAPPPPPPVQNAVPAGDVAAPDVRDLSAAMPAPDAAACRAAGGRIDRRGRMQTAMCVHPYKDGGKACTDNYQCEGKCVAAVDDGPDGSVVGQCQKDDALFGCYAEVVDSKLVRAICVD